MTYFPIKLFATKSVQWIDRWRHTWKHKTFPNFDVIDKKSKIQN